MAVDALKLVEQLTDAQIDDLLQLYRHTAWWGKHRQRADVEKMLAQTSQVIGLQEATTGRLVAFCRLLTDGVTEARCMTSWWPKTTKDRG